MSWFQKTISLPSNGKGFHIITPALRESLGSDLRRFKIGIAHIFILHTSAGLTINENWDPASRADLSTAMDRIVPESNAQGGRRQHGGKDDVEYEHSAEGPDDMPSHVKSSLVGSSVTVPIKDGDFYLGTWQDVQLCEFRTSRQSRKVVVTLQGQ
ncbi:hypothetical protein PYCC9005_004952 [Savitreella phatthalungensis]